MTQDGLIRALRKYARKRELFFDVDTNKGKGSHYVVTLGQRFTTVQNHLNPGRIERVLKQLGVDPGEIQHTGTKGRPKRHAK